MEGLIKGAELDVEFLDGTETVAGFERTGVSKVFIIRLRRRGRGARGDGTDKVLWREEGDDGKRGRISGLELGRKGAHDFVQVTLSVVIDEKELGVLESSTLTGSDRSRSLSADSSRRDRLRNNGFITDKLVVFEFLKFRDSAVWVDAGDVDSSLGETEDVDPGLVRAEADAADVCVRDAAEDLVQTLDDCSFAFVLGVDDPVDQDVLSTLRRRGEQVTRRREAELGDRFSVVHERDDISIILKVPDSNATNRFDLLDGLFGFWSSKEAKSQVGDGFETATDEVGSVFDVRTLELSFKDLLLVLRR